MPSVRDLANDAEYAALSPQAKREVFDAYASQDAEFGALSSQAQTEVRGALGLAAQQEAPPPAAAQPARPGALSRFASNAWQQVNPLESIKGLAQAARHPIETGKALLDAQGALVESGGEAIGQGDTAKGIRDLAAYLVPVLGPMLAKAGDQTASGDIAGGLGTTAGIAANLYGPKAVGAVTKGARARTAGKLYEAALKPSTTIAPARRAGMVEAGLAEGIPVSQAGLEKIGSLIDDLNQNIARRIESAGPARTIDPRKVADRLEDVSAKFSQQVTPKGDLDAIARVREEFLGRFKDGGAGGPPSKPPAEAAHGVPATFEVYHGTNADLSGRKFKVGPAKMESAKAGYFTDDVSAAEEFGGRVYVADVSLKNPAVFDGGGAQWDKLPVKEWTERARAAGHDGMVIKNVIDRKHSGQYSGAGGAWSGTDVLAFDESGIRIKGHLSGDDFVPHDAPPRNLSAAEAQAMKQGTYRQLKGRAYGELKRAEVEAQKALARGLKEELAAQFPELNALNAKEGALIGLEDALEKAVARTSNRQIIGLDSPLAGAAVGAATGSGTAGAVAAVMRETLRHPAVSTRLAIALSKGTKSPLAKSRARIGAYARALGQASDDATSQQTDRPANQ